MMDKLASFTKHCQIAASVLLLSFGMSAPLSAQPSADYPNRIIKMVVPYPPGGGGDIVGRLIAHEIEKALNKTVIIDNKPGAAGNIGAGSVARSDPDGYTILLCTNGILAANPSLYRNIPFDTMKDFSFISQVANAAIVLVVNPSVPVHTLQEFVTLAKKKPDSVSYGSGGVGTGNHLAAELFMADANIKLFHVPYKGTPPAHLDLLGGRINAMFDQVASAIGDIRAGKLRPLAVTSASREATLPDVPTVSQAGFHHSETSTWYGLVAPAGTPDEIVAKLSKVVVDATKKPEVKEAFRKVGLEAVGSNPQETKQYIQSEIVKWKAVIKRANIQPN
jgi:tripartite-type tricarboxylate transporter receptor subunit TctC